MTSADLRLLAEDAHLLEIARRAIEALLIDLRDDRISMPFRGNGLVIREPDGTYSNMIRMGPEDAMQVGLRAIAQHLEGDTCWGCMGMTERVE